MDNPKPTLVIARHNEDISWSDQYPRVIIQKGVDLPNIGREVSSFLYFIVTNYQSLEGDYIFCQGRPFDHGNPLEGDLGKPLTCKPNGSSQHPGLKIHEVCQQLDLPCNEEYTFYAGGQFKVSAKIIQKRTWEWYVKALSVSLYEENPWVFERLWPIIFNENTTK